MNKIEWCLSQNHGIELIESNRNVSELYMIKSFDSLKALHQVDVKSWKITTAYYAMYFALYSIMMRIGVKCEIHDCSLEFMNVFLTDMFNDDDFNLISMARDARLDLQYYVDKTISSERYDMIISHAEDFIYKCRKILSSLQEKEILMIRLNVQKILFH